MHGDALEFWLLFKSFEFEKYYKKNYVPGPDDFPLDYGQVSKGFSYAASCVNVINHPKDAFLDYRNSTFQKHLLTF